MEFIYEVPNVYAFPPLHVYVEFACLTIAALTCARKRLNLRRVQYYTPSKTCTCYSPPMTSA